MFREQSFKELLPCQLTEREKLSKGQELVARLGEKEELEERMKSAASAFKRQITVKDEESRKLSGEIRTGIEHRQIECRVIASFAQNSVETMRMDTGEVIRSRAMLPEERQGALELSDAEATRQ